MSINSQKSMFLILATGAMLVVSGCSSMKAVNRQDLNPNAVQQHHALVVPPDFNLRPPVEATPDAKSAKSAKDKPQPTKSLPKLNKATAPTPPVGKSAPAKTHHGKRKH